MELLSDVRIAARGLRRSKGFAIAAALTLALGIGATTTIFSVVYGILLRPLPYREVDRLVIIEGEKTYSTGPRIIGFSAPELETFAAAAHAFSSIAMSGRTSLSLRGGEGTRSVPGATVSGEFFTALGTSPLLGRTIGDEHDPVIVISERLWRQMFGSSPNTIGRTLELADTANIQRTYTIVGVMPASFQLPYPDTDVWRTLAFARAVGDGRVRELANGGQQLYARLNSGTTFAAAAADASAAVDRALKPSFTAFRTDLHAKTTPLDAYVRGALGTTLWVLMGAVTLVLLVACANVANLILARQASRWREIAVRLALGASRLRLLSSLMTEGALIAAVAAIGGISLAAAAIAVLQWLQPAHINRLDAVSIDLPVLLFATGAAVCSTLLAALSPAILATRTDAGLAQRAGSRGAIASGVLHRLRSCLVIAEIAASIVLVVGAALLARSLGALLDTDLGVNTDNVIAVNIVMSSSLNRPIDDARRRQMTRDLLVRLAALPGVTAVGVGSGVPPSGEFMRVSLLRPNGSATESSVVTMVPASPGYFQALQIRLLAGRLFDDRDDEVSSPVIVINREAARRFFGDDHPVGRTLSVMDKQMTIVGVVDNVKYTGIESGPESVLYQPYAQQPMPMSALFARTVSDPNNIAADVRRMIASYDPGIVVPRVWSLRDWISAATAQPRFRTVLLGSIASITLILAMVGLYSLVSYATSQRTSEIALRMAVGAQQADIVRLVVRDGSGLAIIGIMIGIVGAYSAARLLESFLYRVTATDPIVFAVSAIGLFTVALTASYVPAKRASQIDPMTALRTD